MDLGLWIGWGLTILVSTISFVIVSRARNSASLKRHMVASLFSNGIWFIGQLFVISVATDILKGKYGLGQQLFAGSFYTTMSMLGAYLAHWWALKSEKGDSRVGANKKIHQVTEEEWLQIRGLLDGRR